MPSFFNNRRYLFSLSVKIAFVLIVAVFVLGQETGLSFGGQPASPQTRAETKKSKSERKPFAGLAFDRKVFDGKAFDGKKFFESLRFWEKDSKETSQEKQSAAPASNPERPQTVDQVRMLLQPHPNAPPAADPADFAWQETSRVGRAPVPPPIPASLQSGHYSEDFLRRNMGSGSFGSAPRPLHSFDGQDGEMETYTGSQDSSPGVSYTSYSYDARDWIEYFPQQTSNPTQPETAMFIQTTSFRPETPTITKTYTQLPVTQPPHVQTPDEIGLLPESVFNESNLDERIFGDDYFGPLVRESHPQDGNQWDDNQWDGNQWDGHATNLGAADLPMSPGGQSQASARTSSTEDHQLPLGSGLIDLSPSYQHRLPHTQTRGVVVIQANFPLAEIAPLLSEIEQLQQDLSRYVGLPAPQEKIELCLFKDEDSYIRFLREFFPRAPRDRRALFIKLENKPGTLLVQRSKDFELDLRHEMTHAVVHASVPRVPIWLDEGLAKYFEVPPQDRANNHPYMAQTRWNARMGMIPSLDRLSKLSTINDMGDKEYRDSWAWMHFMIHHSPDTHQLLAAYLQMLSSWEPGGVVSANAMTSGFIGANGGEKLHSILFPGKPAVKLESAPSLKHYLDDMIPNQREAFRRHFGPQ